MARLHLPVLLFSFLFCGFLIGVGMGMVGTPRLRASLREIRPMPVGAVQRSRRSVLVRAILHLVCAAALVALLQLVDEAFNVSLGLLPGIAAGGGGWALWNRDMLIRWEQSHRYTLFAHSEIAWRRTALHAMPAPRPARPTDVPAAPD